MPVNRDRFILVAIILAGLGFPPAHAEPAPQVPPPADTALETAKRAFEALPEPDRKAIQEGLIWTGDYKGIADGRFGKGTREAIAAFAVRSKLPGDGTLDDKGRAALAAAALRARMAVHFSFVADERTAIKIGVPLKLLPKISVTTSGTRYAAADNTAALETSLVPESESNLEQKFDTLRVETAQRKITYKVSRPDFFIVVGEAAGTIFYTRFSRGERNSEKVLAGFTLTYPVAAKATYDMIAIAVASSFEPFSGKPLVATVDHNVAEAAPVKPYLAANGLVIAPGLVVTSLPATGCREAQIGARGVKIAQQDKTSGLALLEAGNLTAKAVHLRSSELTPDMPVVMLAYAPKTGTHTGNAGGDDLVAAAGMLRPGSTGVKVSAAVQGVRAGTAVFDRSGALLGLIGAEAVPDKRVGDVMPVASRPMIDAAALSSFLGSKIPNETDKEKDVAAAPERSLGDIVAENRAALVAVYCVP